MPTTAEAFQRLEAGGPDKSGHRAEGTDGRGPHDHRHEPEDEALEVLDTAQHRLALLAHLLQGEAHEQRDEQGLQYRTRGQ